MVGLVCHSWKILKKREFGQYLVAFFLNVVYQALGPDVTSGGKGKFPLNLLHKEECSNKSVLSVTP